MTLLILFLKRWKIDGLNLGKIEEKEVKQIIEDIIDEKLKLPQNYIFISSAKFRNQTFRLKRLILKAMKYIILSITESDFEVLGHEVEFGENKKYPPIQIELDSGKKVQIVGKIDRIDIAKDEEGRYLRIIDYKSSNNYIKLNDVAYGMQLQLLTYLDATCKIEELEPAAVLYFNLIEERLDKRKTKEEIEQEIKRNFKMKGLVVSDVKLIKMMDKSLDTGGSDLVPAYIKSDGSISEKRSSVATKEQFSLLQKYIIKSIKDISKQILKGKIDIKPYYKNRSTPCEYCVYKAICQFDKNKFCNEYNYIPNLTNEEAWNKIVKECKNDE